MRYIDYGTMQNDAQQRVLEMQRRARNAVCSHLPQGMTNQEYPSEADSVSLPHAENPASPVRDASAALPQKPEEALITMVLVLLFSENADIFLILALLYLLI